MKINGNINDAKNISFKKILKNVKKEFKNKGTTNNIRKYLSRDVKLGTNPFIHIIPLFIKKAFMKYIGIIANQTTSTLSNVGSIKLDEKYRKHVDNILVLVSTGRVQKVKCTICSYENKLTITINSNLITNKFEEEFYRLLKNYVGDFKLEIE